jgi:hypothetical protein
LVLAAVALPTVRNLLKDGKSAHQARAIVAYLNEARTRAIATKSEVGVLLNRVGSQGEFARSLSLQMRLSNSVAPYKGETAAAAALLCYDPASNHSNGLIELPQSSRAPGNRVGPTNAAFFTAADCPLLYLSAVNAANDPQSSQPIGRFDRLELEGGRSVVMTSIIPAVLRDANGGPDVDGVKVIFDPRERLLDSRSQAANPTYPTVAFPASFQRRSFATPVSFKIHRKPNLSNVGALNLMKGMAIDLNYSGVGPNGVQLSQLAIAPTAGTADVPCLPVAIVFAPDGTVSYMNYGIDISGTVVGSVEHPASNIYLLLGKIDGVRPDALLDETSKPPANIVNLESSWIVINPFTGNIQASPVASVDTSSLSTGDIVDVMSAVFQSRQFAFQSDKLSKY